MEQGEVSHDDDEKAIVGRKERRMRIRVYIVMYIDIQNENARAYQEYRVDHYVVYAHTLI